MATTHGNDGIVKIGTDTVAEVVDWSYSETIDLLEDTAMGDTGKTWKSGLKDGSGTINCMWDETDTTGQGTMTTGTDVTLHLMPEGDTTGDTEYTGTVTIESFNVSGGKDSIVSASFTFKGVLSSATVA